MSNNNWQLLLNTVNEIQNWFPDELVFIEEIAVYAHLTADSESSFLAIQSHSVDFMISLSDLIDLRDLEILTPNKTLRKQHFTKNGFEFYVYVQNQTNLCIPVEEAITHSVIKSNLRVVCPMHLLILKAKALQDRRNSEKGKKDEDDIIRTLLIKDNDYINKDTILRMTDDLMIEIEDSIKGDACLRLAKNKHHLARIIKTKANDKFSHIKEVYTCHHTIEP